MPLHKLLNHALNIRALKPVCLTLGIENNCNLNCEFCFVRHRDRNGMSMNLIKATLEQFPTIKSIELGLGEPTLHSHFAEIVDLIHSKGIKLGMGTNGTNLKLFPEDLWRKFSWLSIGITRFIDNRYAETPDFEWLPCRHSFILVLHANTPPTTWQEKLAQFQQVNKEPVLIRLDMNARSGTIGRFKRECPEAVQYRERFVKFNGFCYMGSLKPMIYPDGNVYPCCLGKSGDYYRKYRLGSIFTKFTTTPIQVECDRCSHTLENETIHKFLNDPDPQFM